MDRPELLQADQPGAIDRAAQVIASGGLVAFPTDTVYGVGADAFRAEPISRLFLAKERSQTKSIPVLIADPEDLGKVAVEIPRSANRLAAAFWPGPLTLVLLRNAGLPAEIGPGNTVGVRIPDHPVARSLLRACGPLAVTSANLSAQPSLRTAGEVREALSERIDLVVDGGRTPGGVPSTVVDCLATPPAVLRAGPISRFQILEAIGA